VVKGTTKYIFVPIERYEVRFTPLESDGFSKKRRKKEKRLHNTVQTQ
jgi:hypothetical protein